jgi:hypothetical protein
MVSERTHSRHLWRSIGAVLVGIVVGVVSTIATDIALHVTGVFPPMGQPMSDLLFVLATFYRTVYSVLGSYVIARLAPDRPMQHALAGGIAGVVVATIGAVLTWNKGPAFGPHWYPLTLIAVAIPTAWAGGKIRQAQISRAQTLSLEIS